MTPNKPKAKTITKTVIVTTTVEVTIDESKFTEEFLAEFRESFYQFMDIDRHIRHLGVQCAHGYCNDTFIEGYGEMSDMGIEFDITDPDTEIQK